MPDFTAQLAVGEREEFSNQLRKAETVGRPIGSKKWLEQMEKQTGRALASKKRSRKIDKTNTKSKLSP